MCGIVMMMSADKNKGIGDRTKAFTQGVIIDTMRGHHSTGLAYMDWKGNAEMFKKPLPGYDFVNLPKFGEVMKDADDYPFMIAHNRYATQGAVNTQNAHPFQHGNITGVHNGSLWSYEYLAPDQTFATDSEYVIHALANDDTGRVLADLDGSFALVWHDASDNTMHIARNSERPFWIAHIEGTETVLGVSEEHMLDLICYRNDLKMADKYLAGEETEFVFSLEDLHKPRLIHRKMNDYYTGWYNRQRSTYKGTNTTRKVIDMTTGTTTRDERRKKILGKYATAPIHGYISDFIHYGNNSQYGFILCFNTEDPYDAIRINGLTKHEYDAMDTKDGYFEAEVMASGVDDDKNTYYAVDRDKVTWLTEREAYANFNHATQQYDTDDYDDDEEEESNQKKYQYRRGNQLFTEEEAKRLLACGCGTCGSPISIADFNDVEWWNDTPVCIDCELDVTGGYGI